MKFFADTRGASGRHISGRLTVIAACCLAVIVGVGVLVGGAGAASTIYLGKGPAKPKPMCGPKASTPCSVEGHVTAFQRRLAGKGRVFEAKRDGKIVAWSLRMGNPSKETRKVLGSYTETPAWGKKPTAGIAILKPVKGGEFKLKSRSPVVLAGTYYGRNPVITLEQPLGVRAGDIVALTIPTWLPTYRNGIGSGKTTKKNSWRGSRPSNYCSSGVKSTDSRAEAERKTRAFIAASKPQTKVGSKRKYGCVYKGERLFYGAYMVPN